MLSMKFFIFSLMWIVLYCERAKDGSLLTNYNKSPQELNRRILRLETPEPWGDSQTYEITTTDKFGNLITTVFNKNAEALYFYINRRASKGGGSSRGRNSKLRKRKR
ncbi:conserved Plasmodium protein, unknown function [Plasmodium knowlesi strain H]|uniref:Uncharacterized protein n=3 Tax=Plasmodium knowlesi TaxID=5850 RepID=A0A5K1VD64_PLAKH|nr:conserved Plasmodium protein, unknown function [Plasmodium knowlesi strain H]OTN68499.1 Uncharacterized protein PKNOH_S02313200 [Plasmodium knowlesi]CAA9986633.1 conserved Plasmodium protein, unknown function [Plasmodium knowlesi strain H]SBO24086.1 conserved Plasmodium protein, unknown function [Plasmodium knowlesi strain H]SBO29343.1 conserved Plasmodium protein, unknown function [Plasmodium knowlesi strain H]VVS76107.1 conserved Plasmodium protein, unknown function [Plasmodium knowlesi s|eukprot:XP_002261173.1 hypothetical protein, conserved in Plasmodium species [Plasmodium knowlesi strain H]